MFSHLHEVEMTRWYPKEHDLMGFDADDFLSTSLIIEKKMSGSIDTRTKTQLIAREQEVHNWAISKEWSACATYEKCHDLLDYPAKLRLTFDKYQHIDYWQHINSHEPIKMKKHCYATVLYQVCREIKHWGISRVERLPLNSYNQEKMADYQSPLQSWLSV